MPRLLKDLHINDVSSVTRGAGVGVRVMLMKRDNTTEAPMQTNSDPYTKLVAVAKTLQRNDESIDQTIARSRDWRDPRYDKTVADLFNKSAAAGGPYGHGTVRTVVGDNNFNANSDEGEKIRERGITDQHGEALSDNDYRHLDSVPRGKKSKVADLAAKKGVSLREAKREVMGA